MKTPTPHPHAAMIEIWVKDTNRVVEVLALGFSTWRIVHSPSWQVDCEYRFADTVEPVIVSSLSDDAITDLVSDVWGKAATLCLSEFRVIADAAATRAIEDLQVLECSISGWDAFGISNIYHKQDMDPSFEHVAAMVIDDYIKQVKAGKK